MIGWIALYRSIMEHWIWNTSDQRFKRWVYLLFCVAWKEKVVGFGDKEIRLNPGVSDILNDGFEKANDEVYKIEKKYALKKWFFGFMRRYVCNSFFADVLFIGYLVYFNIIYAYSTDHGTESGTDTL